ncbi:ABC transporter substrate-binding protein [Xanthobacter tagetidis]|jgi:NitT/TauT family transport system substrate-binding protein|uniref:ABC transporter substrate-binding protein n=1 Tax=Xanthobacter tagetidis TaxID=60216 RepID=A0A3L7A678_9HYPH|nr:ABC transporter substrate-binding protein [Xanthobacter tagetidis]MBB6307282.1 NitT/TauT family transport system substrate-binding protein [Xanthobacter tagetidis]RLP75826.1 ABC transporter substrate-binding protein [Xanthobacter tagetidis]
MTVLKSALALAAALGLAAAVAGPASAQQAEKPKLTLGVGGKPLLYYLPLTIAERKGFFKDEGLDVTINDFGGGAKSLQALVGGSVDVVTGAYEHTIRMQAKGQDIVSVIELGRYPGIVLVAKKDGKIKSVKDMKGAKVGVTAPGSSTNFFVNFLLAKDGLKPDDVAFVGVGGGASAVAQMKRGELDAMSNLDPVITKLESDGDVVVIADSRTEAGNDKIFGGTNPAAVLYLKRDFTEQNPVTTQKLVNAFYKTLQWLKTATPEDIAAVVPEEYLLGDKALYLAAVKNSMPIYSKTGVIPESGMKNALNMLVEFDPELKAANVDLAKTFDPRFVAKAAGAAK